MEYININIFNILILSGVIHGFIFSFIVLSSKKIKNNNFLALTVLFLSLSNLQYWAIDVNLIKLYPLLNYVFIPCHWLILPMFYFYIERFTGKPSSTSLKKILFITPFFIVLAIHFCQVFYKFFIDESYIIPSHFRRGIYVYIEFFSFIFNIAIILLTYRKIKLYESDYSTTYKELKPETKWLKELIAIGLIICICWLIALIVVVIYDLNKSYVFYPMWIGISALVYWMGYIGLGKSQLLEERIALRKQREHNIIQEKAPSKKSTINVETFVKFHNNIESKNLYLDPELSIETLAKELDLKANIISQLINQNTDYNFNDYINSFRVKDVKKMLEHPDYANYTIVAIGLEAGFNSKASFYRAFKKFEGMTPSEYLKK